MVSNNGADQKEITLKKIMQAKKKLIYIRVEMRKDSKFKKQKAATNYLHAFSYKMN